MIKKNHKLIVASEARVKIVKLRDRDFAEEKSKRGVAAEICETSF